MSKTMIEKRQDEFLRKYRQSLRSEIDQQLSLLYTAMLEENEVQQELVKENLTDLRYELDLLGEYDV